MDSSAYESMAAGDFDEMNNTKDGFRIYFEKMTRAWHDRFGSGPRIPFDDELEPDLLVSEPDEGGLAEWQPREVANPSLPNQIGDCKISDLVVEYFDSYRFLAAGGKIGEFAVQLSPITEEFVNHELPRRLAGYRQLHGDKLLNVPIGIETRTGKIVVLSNTSDSGAIAVEDDETLELTRIASNPYELLIRLDPLLNGKESPTG